MPHVAALIVAAGSSRRAGFDKLAALLGGEPVLKRSIDALLGASCIGEVVVVCPLDRWELLGLHRESFRVPVCRVDGGAERQDSVAAGLAALSDEATWVAVHDAARPLVRPEDVMRCFRAAQESGAAACAHPVADTLKRAIPDGFSTPEAVDRNGLWAMETPQIFDVRLLSEAYRRVGEQGLTVTDEVSAMETLGVATKLVVGGINFKITLPGDLELAELVWQYGR